MASLPKWVITGDVLHLVEEDGTVHVPSTEEIYSVAVENKLSVDLPTPIDIGGHCALSYSRYPLVLEVAIEADPHAEPPGLVLAAYAKGVGVRTPLPDILTRTAEHVVASGVWYPLVHGEMQDLRNTMRAANVAQLGPLSLKQYLDLIKLPAATPTIADLSRGAASAAAQRWEVSGRLPQGFAGKLYSYQHDGWRWLQLVTDQDLGGILADEMGLGKTVQIVVLLLQESISGRRPSLVIGPGTILENWRREVAKFAPGLSVSIHRGPDRTGFPSELAAVDIVVTSYDTLVRDLPMFRAIQWNVVVLDEAQAIKNAETKRAVAAKRVPRRVGLAVTGTPIENCLTDLWSIADFAIPGLLGRRDSFESTFQNDVDGAERLEPLVTPILLRRRVLDVASDLPERIDIPQVLVLTSDQASEYEAIRQSIVDQYGPMGGLIALTKLRQYCCHPWLVSQTQGDLISSSPKYERLTEIAEEIVANGDKALVFTAFQGMFDILERDLASRFGVPAFAIDGRVEIVDRQPIVDKFSDVSGPAFLVLNPRAAGMGLNITAANHVIHYNLEWNPAVEEQASARAYRRGQTRPVTVHRLFYSGTVEEVMDRRLASKKALADTAVVGTTAEDDSLADIRDALARSPINQRGGKCG